MSVCHFNMSSNSWKVKNTQGEEHGKEVNKKVYFLMLKPRIKLYLRI